MIFFAGALVLFLLLWGLFNFTGPIVLRMIRALGEKTASFRYGEYLGVVLLLAVGSFITVRAGDGFLDLAELLTKQSPELRAIDTQVHRWAATERSTGATTFFMLMTTIGTPVGLGIIVAIVCCVLLAGGRYRWFWYLLTTSAVGALMVVRLKLYFARERPALAEALRQAHGYSFPSGHAMGSTVVALALAYLVSRTKWAWKVRAALLSVLVTFIVSVAFSRVYLGVHWISDVAAGITGGTLWVTVATLGYETVRRVRKVRALRAARVSEGPPA
ncbi:MAG: phosphatase PAP2 family protein [Thermoanaerobaculia bacterium]|nr:phosphatase PAP2 family protein [Thermoanaerobaculia bacterium]